RLTDVERPERRDQLERARNVGAVAFRRLITAEYAFGNKNFRRHIMGTDDPQAEAVHHARHGGQQPVVAAAERARDARHQPDRLPIEANLRERRAEQRADEQRLTAMLGIGKTEKSAQLSDCDPVMGILLDDLRVGPAFNREHHWPPAAARDGIGDRAGKAAAAADDRKWLATGPRGSLYRLIGLHHRRAHRPAVAPWAASKHASRPRE